jgi:hypothetical protein
MAESPIWNVSCSSEGQIREPTPHATWSTATFWCYTKQRGLTAILLEGGIGAKGQQNGQRQAPHLNLCDFTVSGWAKTAVKPPKPGIFNCLDETGDTFGTVRIQFWRRSVEHVPSRLHKCVRACVVCARYCGLCWHPTLNFGAKSTMPIPRPIQGSFFFIFSPVFTPPKKSFWKCF